jgi:multiple sugar transport system substrate-binding protein
MARALAPAVRSWEDRTGAKVTLTAAPMTPDDATDVGVIPATELGAWADPGRLAPVPPALRNDPAFQWRDLLPAYGERFVNWGGDAVALPLTGDSAVLVYRRDRYTEPAVRDALTKRFGAARAPATWEELAEQALAFADLDKRPSLPPLPTDPARALDLFSRAAACFDRKALSDAETGTASDPEALAFHYSATTGAPRVTAPGFRTAALMFARLSAGKALPPGDAADQVAALAEGRATFALLNLEEVARLPKEGAAPAARFGLAPVPGAATYFDQRQQKTVTGAPNAVPYFAGARLAVVRARCASHAAAFELLAELAGPARSAEFVATPGLNAGPTRGAHLERDRLAVWLPYGFEAERTRQLQDALRAFAGVAVRNPTLALRGPDRAAVVGAVGPALKSLAAGASADAALAEAEKAWLAADARFPADDLRRWRGRAAGKN